MRRDSNNGLPPNPNFTIRSNNQQHSGEFYGGGYKGGSQNNFDDGDSSQKSKPFRIKEMGKDHMNNTGISTTTSANTNRTYETKNSTNSRREHSIRNLNS